MERFKNDVTTDWANQIREYQRNINRVLRDQRASKARAKVLKTIWRVVNKLDDKFKYKIWLFGTTY